MYRTDTDQPEHPVRTGYQRYDYQNGDPGESGTAWWLIGASVSDETALRLAGYPEQSYRGPGREFSGAPHVMRTRTRTLVTQYQGLDV